MGVGSTVGTTIWLKLYGPPLFLFLTEFVFRVYSHCRTVSSFSLFSFFLFSRQTYFQRNIDLQSTYVGGLFIWGFYDYNNSDVCFLPPAGNILYPKFLGKGCF